MKTYAFDYETYYSKEYSVKDLGNYGYTHHPEFDPYLLSVVGEGGYEWVGSPKEFDWPLFFGQGVTLLSHNAGFEFSVTTRLQELKVIPNFSIEGRLYDTADLAAYLGSPRSLAEAAAFLLNVKADKTMRDKAKGVHWSAMPPETQELMKQYALTDSRLTFDLWYKFNELWPQWERELSRLTREMCVRGLPVDEAKVRKAAIGLEKRLMNAKSIIPWVQADPDAPVLSLKRAGMEARKHNIVPPSSFAKDSEEFEAWAEEHKEKLPWVQALGDYRSINILHKRVETLAMRVHNGVFRYGLKYFGAHTGRDSGDGGFNVQNPPREAMHGVDLRSLMISAPDGYQLGIVDESAIEPRCLAVLSGDDEMVALLNQGYDPYEAQARSRNQYSGDKPLKDVDPKLRQFKKVEVLGLGYGAGPEKAQFIAKKMAGLELSLEQAEDLVQSFRSRKYIPALWNKLETACRAAAPSTFELELPSGRVLNYRDVKNFGSISAVIPRMGKMMRVKLWGGSLCENLIQAVARDIFMWHVLQINDAGIPILLRAHDEVVTLLKEEIAQDQLAQIKQIMCTAPPWMPDFPASADGGLAKTYKKL